MSLDDISDVKKHYEKPVYREEERLPKHQIEFEITMRHIADYLPRSCSILDVGCGAGAYTIPLAKLGHTVCAIDISSRLIEICMEKSIEQDVSQRISTYVADAREIDMLDLKTYDAVLMMGPLYHLIKKDDRRLAIKQAITHLVSGGVFVSAHISRFGMIADLVKKIPHWAEDMRAVDELLSTGRDPDTHPRDGGFRGYFATVEELAPLHEEMGLKTVRIATSDPCGTAIDDVFLSLTERQKKAWIDILYKISSEPSFRGAWCHMLYIGKKP